MNMVSKQAYPDSLVCHKLPLLKCRDAGFGRLDAPKKLKVQQSTPGCSQSHQSDVSFCLSRNGVHEVERTAQISLFAEKTHENWGKKAFSIINQAITFIPDNMGSSNLQY
jgi:hypothetical protein